MTQFIEPLENAVRCCRWLLGIGLTSFAAQLLLNRGFQIEVAVKASAVNYTQVTQGTASTVVVRDHVTALLCTCMPPLNKPREQLYVQRQRFEICPLSRKGTCLSD